MFALASLALAGSACGGSDITAGGEPQDRGSLLVGTALTGFDVANVLWTKDGTDVVFVDGGLKPSTSRVAPSAYS